LNLNTIQTLIDNPKWFKLQVSILPSNCTFKHANFFFFFFPQFHTPNIFGFVK